MATGVYAAIVAITLALGSASASAKFTIPFLGHNVCKVNVFCGKGKCVASNSSSFGFACECEKGWTQSRPHDSTSFKFLPCVVPQFTVNFSSGDNYKAPAPAPSINKSSFDPCSWTNCGGGTCKKTSMLTHSCECKDGYYNLFNSSSFPCYKQRAIGGESPDPGNTMTNSSTPSPRQSSNVVADSASSFITSSWLMAMVAMSAPFLWNYS
ncbi:hypothetical protein AAHA92_16838 [Salvia divinorum]|uniref:EGF-like domain-containing protein n=1 Tax=Salvia divinorum TaxID=28513 RepID=A0ABD1GXY2_SALDI